MAESERLAVDLGLPLEPTKEPQHGPTLRGDLEVDGHRPPVRPPETLRAHPNEAVATHPVEEPLEGLRMHVQGLADLLVTIPRSVFQERQELPGIGVTQDVDQVLVGKSHHKR